MLAINKTKIRATLIALYLFQFGFMQPIASIVNSQWPIVVSTMVITIIAMWSNDFKIKKYNIIILIGIILYFSLNMLIKNQNAVIIFSLLMGYITKCFSGVYVGSLEVDSHDVYVAFLKVAVFNFFAIGLYPFVDQLDSMNYMRFGYAMLPSFFVFVSAFFKEQKKIIWFILLIFSFFEIILYGSRGPLISILIFALLMVTVTTKIKMYKKIIVAVIIVFGIVIAFKIEIFSYIVDFLYVNYGHQSYSVRKLKMMMEQGLLESSSGRDGIYSNIITAFKSSVIFGKGVGYAQYTWELTAHNIILQILLESGIIGLFFWIAGAAALAMKYIKVRRDDFMFYIFTMLVAISLGRLSVSSDIWLRTELWFFISMLINYKYKRIFK